STDNDPAGRPRVIDLLPEVPERVYAVGRLDEESMGLMILTNDGELANRLAHPRYGVEKTYRALVAGTPGREILDKLTEGIWLSDGKSRAKRASFAGSQGEATTLELVLAEGKKREIRRMLAKLGHKVMSLTRIAIGPVVLKGLSSGEHRPLSRSEVDLLRKVAAGIELAPPRSSEHRGSRSISRPTAPGPQRSGGRPKKTSESEGRAPRTRARSRNEEERPRRDRAPRAARPLPARQKPNPSDRTPGQPTPGRPMPGKPMPGSVMPGKPMPGKPVQDRSAVAGLKVKPGQPVSPPSCEPTPTAFVKPKPAPPMPPPGPRANAGKPPSSEAKPTRRVIGLDPKIAEEAGLSLSGRPARKRPAIARRPPRKVLGVKRSGEGEDER
ncbi:MAG TPA: pseudouridine synthase, partial [Isosphaeraceae bacterium]|nr:pseudouridine synthase [Isosphaeraceae bacterium]